MAAEKSSSQSGAQNELVPGERPPMPADLFSAVMEGKENVIIQCLGLSEEQREFKVLVDKPDPTLQQTETKNETIRCNIQSATQSGDTVLHLLVQKGDDELAVKVFQKEMSLLKARNYNHLETPLHIAARTGNEKVVGKLVLVNNEIVKDALAETNACGDTALHVAARHGNECIGCLLMNLNPAVMKNVNKDGLTPLYVAIDSRCTEMGQTMLENDASLAYSPGPDGMFPIHAAARKGNMDLISYFMNRHSKHAMLLDPHGRNLFHIAAQENQAELFELSQYWYSNNIIAEVKKMNGATDYEGNTPLHIAANKGHRLTMSVICKNKLNFVAETIRNRQGFKPLQLSAMQVAETSEIKNIKDRIQKYIFTNGVKFSSRWFEDIMAPSDKSKWERTQVIGLGAVLITTITFAAAFTIPGGYNQNDGTPILGRKAAYKAFTVANTLSFVLAFTSLYTLVSGALVDPDYADLKEATDTFTASAGFMVLAFALGSYVMLVPVSFPIAIVVLIFTVPLGPPFMSHAVKFYKTVYKSVHKYTLIIIEWMFSCIMTSTACICHIILSIPIMIVELPRYASVVLATWDPCCRQGCRPSSFWY